MKNERRTVPDELRASFLHSEDEDEDLEEERELDCIPEASRGDEEQVELNDVASEVHNSRFGIHRTSSSSFNALCASFFTKSPHQLAASVSSGVKERFRDSLSESLLRDYDNKDCIAPFNSDEIVLGRKLGSGEFSHVFKVKSFRLNSSFEGSMSAEECDVREYMKGREKYRDTNKSTYALKHLRPELLNKYEPSEYAQFASDLVQEAEFLSLLQHPNIIKLRGSSCVGFNGFEQGPKGYFLIIDRLEETLVDRIAKWKKGLGRTSLHILQNQISTAVSKSTNKKGNAGEGTSLLSQQLEVVLQIAAAMLYLHQKNIIFRDLKPANVGFDVRGDVKLFDFGLAKMMPSNGDSYRDQFEMSGAGSPRYMAPEVLSSEPSYNLKADVYTFSLVLWEVLALEKPYALVKSRKSLIDHVVTEGGRPRIGEGWPLSIKDVLHMGFDSQEERPSMEFIFEAIRVELCKMRNGDNSKLRNSYLLRRRSLGSIRQMNGVRKQRKGIRLYSSLTSSLSKLSR